MMSRIHAIGISLATAVLVLSYPSPAPVHAQQRPVLKASYFGRGATLAGVTVGDVVLLTARAAIPAGWHLEIQGRRLQPFWSVLQTCAASPCEQRVFSNRPGTFRFRAVLSRGTTSTEIPSAEINVVWVTGGCTAWNWQWGNTPGGPLTFRQVVNICPDHTFNSTGGNGRWVRAGNVITLTWINNAGAITSIDTMTLNAGETEMNGRNNQPGGGWPIRGTRP
jgi:hypothetical protein